MIERIYRDTDFSDPKAVCDVVMKGGITSGAVYPLALVELAKRYRFAQIGGTSAGAIAAAAAAAAEYGRHVPGKGFMRLTLLPAEMGRSLFKWFQPSPAVAPIFGMLVAMLKAKSTPGKYAALLWTAIWGFRWLALLFAVIAAAVAYLCWRYAHVGDLAFGILLTLIGLFAGVLVGLYRAATIHLPANNYGLCPGITQKGHHHPGFTDWLADLIDDTAGRTPGRDDPLTFGDLAAPGNDRPSIGLQMMTTNLMMSRPYSLPFDTENYKFKRDDFERIFPKRIVDYLVRNSQRFTATSGEEGEYYTLPPAEKLPVVVAARMSLSFPILISAVPLYTLDYTLKKEFRETLKLCLFSDGGLSSNFPIHLFDHMLPNRPTFGISLGEYDWQRDRNSSSPGDANNASLNRVWMPRPDQTGSGSLLPILPIDGLGGFLYRLVNAAKDWQDNMQGTLAGSRDRIVNVFLTPNEGGLNITMPSRLVDTLGEYGAFAGDKLCTEFDLDEHRWRRFLVAMDRFDHTAREFIEAYEKRPGAPGSFSEFLQKYPSNAKSYKSALLRLPDLVQRAADLADLARKWRDQTPIPDAHLPSPKTDLRVTPRC